MDKKAFAWFFIAFFSVYTILFFAYYQAINDYVVAATPLVAYLVYLFSDPHTWGILALGLFFGARAQKIGKYFIASFLVALAFDQISPPACATTIQLLQNGVNGLCSDVIFIKWFTNFIDFNTAKIFYYIVLPITEMLVSIELVAEVGFVNILRGQGKV